MVAEFVARQQSGSPVNGETPHQNHTPSNMPANGNANNANMRLDTSSPILQINTNSNGPTSNGRMMTPNGQNGQTYLHEHGNLLMTPGPMSPQSPGSDGGYMGVGYDLAAQLKRKELFTQRKQREFIPENKKDDSYWDRRRRNNEAAKRSREKRRYNDMVLEQRVVELTKENHVLKAQLEAIKDKFNITAENLVSVDQIMATLPTSEQVLSITKRAKLTNTVPPTIIYPGSPSPAPSTGGMHQPLGIESPPSPRLHHTPAALHPQPAQQQPQAPPSKHQPQPAPMASHHHFRSCQSTSPPHMDYRENEAPYLQHHASNSPTGQHMHHHRHHHPAHPHVQFATTANITTIPTGASVGPPAAAATQLSATAAVALATNISSMCYTPTGVVNVLAAAAVAGAPLAELHQYDTTLVTATGNVLNLSRRAQSPYELSSGAGSGTASGDDEQCDNQPSTDINNSLPLKLRHKSHLGDKDAATALLALQHIKQEPNSRASPPWDGEGSSDERDSGISIGTDWAAGFQRKISPVNEKEEENIHLKSQIARLESEVATIKNMMILNTTAGQGATATAQ